MKVIGKVFTYWSSIAFDAWMVMFALAAFDHPTAYWKCLIGAYAVTCVMSSGIYGGALATINDIKKDDE